MIKDEWNGEVTNSEIKVPKKKKLKGNVKNILKAVSTSSVHIQFAISRDTT